MLQPVSIRKFLLACLADCPADNHARSSHSFYMGRCESSEKIQFFNYTLMSQKIIILLIVSFLFSCEDRRHSNDIINEVLKNPQLLENAVKVKKAEKVELSIFLSDTLENQTAAGYIIYSNPIDDTTKISKKDERYVRLYLNVYDLKIDEESIRKIVSDTFITYTKDLNADVKIDFHIQNENLKGLKYLKYEIVDYFYLNSYTDSSNMRILESNYETTNTVYFK